ncbi:hypothetical protein [Bacillus wiedmannii]|uniref:Uncharacterized protein n=1 Tax=Bacillus wiedmannii TaxID=1890302 RepID=A0A2A8BTG8_9BACI|nr:hypothetical protein [Bacillus wiedmannii]PEM58076.1 hypothetical protein CN611_06035 [Bacillus wiedmannii]PGA94768.1 hypothetical protein COL92_23940 [Bacillus wiedmannii]
MKKFGKLLLAGTLALGSLTAMNLETPTAQADRASEYCRYICGPKETLNKFTIQLSDTKYKLGQNIILRATNDNAYDVHYTTSFEKQYDSGWDYYDADFRYGSLLPAGTNVYEDFDATTGNGGAISLPGTYRMKIVVIHADGHVDTMYTVPITLLN